MQACILRSQTCYNDNYTFYYKDYSFCGCVYSKKYRKSYIKTEIIDFTITQSVSEAFGLLDVNIFENLLYVRSYVDDSGESCSNDIFKSKHRLLQETLEEIKDILE